MTYKLPSGLVCDHCVLQWRYTAGNNWGTCKNGTQGLGCGNQEQFGACSDISIVVARNTEQRQSYEDIPYPLFFYLRHGFFDVEKGELEAAMVRDSVDVEQNVVGVGGEVVESVDVVHENEVLSSMIEEMDSVVSNY